MKTIEALEKILKGSIEDLSQPYDGPLASRPALEELQLRARRQAFMDVLNILQQLEKVNLEGSSV